MYVMGLNGRKRLKIFSLMKNTSFAASRYSRRLRPFRGYSLDSGRAAFCTCRGAKAHLFGYIHVMAKTGESRASVITQERLS